MIHISMRANVGEGSYNAIHLPPRHNHSSHQDHIFQSLISTPREYDEGYKVNPAMKSTMCRPRDSQREQPRCPSLDHKGQSAQIACCARRAIGWSASIMPFSKLILSSPVRLDAIPSRTVAFR